MHRKTARLSLLWGVLLLGLALVSAHATEVSPDIGERLLEEGKPGEFPLLTIDPQLQEVARELLGKRSGAIVAMDPANGDIRALWSNPYPLAVRGLFPPGSTFKLVVAAAALESGHYTPQSTFTDPVALDLPFTKRTVRNITKEPCTKKGKIDLFAALKVSCDTTFAAIGLRIPDEIYDMAERLGFNAPLPFDMRSLASVFPRIDDKDRPLRAYVALGQHDVAATPLHMTLIAAAIANEGVMLRPRVVKGSVDHAGTVLESRPTEVLHESMSPATAQVLTQMMTAAVDGGTGVEARIKGVKVAGKTGTAQHVAGADPHVWFLGFAPAESPYLVVGIFLREGGGAGPDAMGGTVAAPLAKRMIEADREIRGW